MLVHRDTNIMNHLTKQQDRLQQLLIHSISQNNNLGTFSISIMNNVEKRLSSIEERIAGLSGQQGPPMTLQGQDKTMNQIT